MAKEHSNVRLGFWCLTQMGSLYFTGTLLLGVATAAGLAAALLFQPLFDKGLIGRDGSVLLSIVALQLALMLSRILLTRGALDLLARAAPGLASVWRYASTNICNDNPSAISLRPSRRICCS